MADDVIKDLKDLVNMINQKFSPREKFQMGDNYFHGKNGTAYDREKAFKIGRAHV